MWPRNARTLFLHPPVVFYECGRDASTHTSGDAANVFSHSTVTFLTVGNGTVCPELHLKNTLPCFGSFCSVFIWRCVADACIKDHSGHREKLYWARWRVHDFPDFSAVGKNLAAPSEQNSYLSVQLWFLHTFFDARLTHRGNIETNCIEPGGGLTFLRISAQSSKIWPRRLHRIRPQVFSCDLCIHWCMPRACGLK